MKYKYRRFRIAGHLKNLKTEFIKSPINIEAGNYFTLQNSLKRAPYLLL